MIELIKKSDSISVNVKVNDILHSVDLSPISAAQKQLQVGIHPYFFCHIQGML